MTRSSSLLAAIASSLGVALVAAPAAAQFRCPPGYVRDRFRRCVPIRVAACPAGYVLRGRTCVPVAVAPRPRLCPPGYFYFRGRCRLR